MSGSRGGKGGSVRNVSVFGGDTVVSGTLTIGTGSVSITSNANTGGHFAHLGGAIFGWIFVKLLQEGHDLSLPFNRMTEYIQYLFSSNKATHRRNNPLKVIHKNSRSKVKSTAEKETKRGSSIDYQAQLDHILDKIKQKGYDSLSDEEKEFLFQASKK